MCNDFFKIDYPLYDNSALGLDGKLMSKEIISTSLLSLTSSVSLGKSHLQ